MKFIQVLLSAIVVLNVCFVNKASGQRALDSKPLGSIIETIHQSVGVSDSVQSKETTALSRKDTLHLILQQKITVDEINHTLDSIQDSFNNVIHTVEYIYHSDAGKLVLLWESIFKELDSFKTRNLPENHVVEKLDSLTKLQHDLTVHFETKLQEMKDLASSKIADLNLPPELAEKAKTITGNINDAVLSNPTLKLPGLEGFDNSLENLNGIGKLESLNSSEFPTEIGNVEIPPGLSGAGSLTKPTLPAGNITDIETLSKAAEEKATDISGIKEMEKQTESLDEYKEAISKPPNQDSIKEMAIAQLRQVAVNHFAGKEQVMQEAMETMSKYKKKYTSVVSISELPRKRPNEMKGKPFIERIIPGIAMQIHKQGDDFMVDFNAYAAYRFTRKMNAGIGWNQRVAYNMNYNGLNANVRIFGPRVFGEYNLWKGFFHRAELELMNTNLPPVTRGSTPDPLHREWVWGAFVGLKKEYRIIRNIKGTAMVMTRLFNPDNKSPYADVLNVRFGFEFPVKKKASISDTQ